jgi:CxxC motif-containing protein (DUF1111 family)
MKRWQQGGWAPVVGLLAFVILATMPGCGDDDDAADDNADTGDPGDTGAPPTDDPRLSGGRIGTVFDVTGNAYARPLPILEDDNASTFAVGNSFFNTNWVAAPASTTARDGLGPLYNATSCSACHEFDGRGPAPTGPEDLPLALLVRVSLPGTSEHGGPVPVPVYGDQIQHRAILGVDPEADFFVRWEDLSGRYPDGTSYTIRKPVVELANWRYGSPPVGMLTSPRIAPGVFGVGLLEAIPEAAIRAAADPDDTDGDGISGRVNEVWDVSAGRTALGRFGWKANQPSNLQQTAGAFAGDIGITTPLFSAATCGEGQTSCLAAPDGGAPELPGGRLAQVAGYVRTLAVPARRDVDDPTVLRGEALFKQVNCTACHTAKQAMGAADWLPGVTGETIRPYTDLLLHDMGAGLADGRPDFLATGSEWRTPPLWGLGLLRRVNDHDNLLHDGRARGPEEAILWHGGEAEASTEAFKALTADERNALLRFLESL